ncbi:phage tail assembly protein [Nautilia sp. PV-1]|jgi:hypothetical protein|uniref:phage tail assembly protein n=1 Tax=Nautilia sp. PV-1 TaxID=2579250 RepID=UPI000FD80AFE|nr:phage tail assembly protein [Nautilia sp. PV-1]AZV46842.1 phage tail assembly protein [Nautilia sp. PV-1]
MKEIKLSDGRVIKMRSPKVRDIRAIDKIEGESEKEITLISNLTGLSIAELDDLDLKEYKKLQDALAGFLS